jgi:hypothetical protein
VISAFASPRRRVPEESEIDEAAHRLITGGAVALPVMSFVPS